MEANMAQKRKRRRHSRAFKEQVVARLFDGTNLPIEDASEEFDVTSSVLRRWARDPRYGGIPNAFTRTAREAAYAAKRNRQNPDPLGVKADARKLVLGSLADLPVQTAPTEPVRNTRVKDLTPLIFRCPHCQGQVRMPE